MNYMIKTKNGAIYNKMNNLMGKDEINNKEIHGYEDPERAQAVKNAINRVIAKKILLGKSKGDGKTIKKMGGSVESVKEYKKKLRKEALSNKKRTYRTAISSNR